MTLNNMDLRQKYIHRYCLSQDIPSYYLTYVLQQRAVMSVNQKAE